MDEYIQQFPKPVQEILEKIRQIAKKAAPEAKETINYGIPTFKLGGKNLIHFAAFKQHIGLYPTPAVIEAFKKKLLGYKTAKGSIQFPLNKSIPFDLIKKIILFRTKM